MAGEQRWKRVRFPDGSGEVRAWWQYDVIGNSGVYSRSTPGLEVAEVVRAAYREQAGRRAKVHVVTAVRAGGHNKLGTLTFNGVWPESHDYDVVQRIVARFFRRWLSDELDGNYVVVFELCEGGQWHCHFSFRTGIPVFMELTRRWTEHLGEYGLVPVGHSYIRTNVRPFDCSLNAALYLSKYLGKTFTDGDVPPGRHRFSRGRRLPQPEVLLGQGGCDNEDLSVPFAEAEKAAAGSPVATWVHPVWLTVVFSWPGPAFRRRE